jgi:protoporphyrin/coproporphyrin ferrochelatase
MTECKKESSKIVLVHYGSPRSPHPADIRDFLKRMLTTPGIAPSQWFWPIILNTLILPWRPYFLKARYAQIWDGQEMLLVSETNKLVAALAQGTGRKILPAFLFSQPFLEDLLPQLGKDDLVIPLFPQNSFSTTGIVKKIIGGRTPITAPFFNNPSFIQDSVSKIENCLSTVNDHLVIAFHSLPLSLSEQGDPYLDQCQETFRLIKEKITKLPDSQITYAYQSQMSFGRWAGPGLKEHCLKLKEQGANKIAIYPASFVLDCLETREEIGLRLAGLLQEQGLAIQLIPPLNQEAVNTLASLLKNS